MIKACHCPTERCVGWWDLIHPHMTQEKSDDSEQHKSVAQLWNHDNHLLLYILGAESCCSGMLTLKVWSTINQCCRIMGNTIYQFFFFFLEFNNDDLERLALSLNGQHCSMSRSGLGFSESWLVASNLVWYGQRKLSCEWVVKHITSQICIKILHLDCSRKIRASSTWPLLCSMLIWWQTARSKYVKDIWTNMHKVANCPLKFAMVLFVVLLSHVPKGICHWYGLAYDSWGTKRCMAIFHCSAS